jgi:hypothetical protein
MFKTAHGQPGTLDTKTEFHANINISSHLDNLGKVDSFLGCFLQVRDREDLEAGVVDLISKSGKWFSCREG